MKRMILMGLWLAGSLAHAHAHAPAPASSSDLPLPLYWLDMGVLRDLESRAQEGELWKGWRLMGSPDTLRPYAHHGPVVWGERFGVAAEKLHYFVHHPGTGRADEQSLWIFADAASAKAVFEHLDREGFVALPEGEKVLGTPGKLDLLASDDFWRMDGQPVVFALKGDLLWQGRDLPAAIVPEDNSLSSLILWQSSLVALQTVLPDDARLLQASFFTIEQGLYQSEPDMAAVLALGEEKFNPEKLKELFAVQAGVPPYFGGIFADAQQGDKAVLLLALVYPDCDTAAKAQALLPERWAQWQTEYPMLAGGALDTQQVKPGIRSNLCFAVLRHTSDNPRPEEHQALSMAWHAFNRGKFSVVRML